MPSPSTARLVALDRCIEDAPASLQGDFRRMTDALQLAWTQSDYTGAPLADAVFALGRTARRAAMTADDLVAALESAIRHLLEPNGRVVGDAVLVYLWRFARRGYHGDAPVRPIDLPVSGRQARPVARGDRGVDPS